MDLQQSRVPREGQPKTVHQRLVEDEERPVRYGVKLRTYGDLTMDSWVYGENDFWSGSLGEAQAKRDEWAARNPKGLYEVVPMAD